MKNTTLSTKMLCAVLVAFLALTSCTKDTPEEDLYEQGFKKTISPFEKPKIDRMDVTVEPDRSVDETACTGRGDT